MPLAPGELPAELVAAGAAYAAALLVRIAAGPSTAADFAGLMAWLQCYPMLCGFAGVLLDRLRQAVAAPHRGPA